MMKTKRILSSLVAATLIFSIGVTSVSASRNDNNKKFQQYYSKKVTGVPYGIAKKVFNDLEKFPWAEKAIEKMRLKGLLKGKEDGVYAPKSSVTKLESIIMALRIMGWEDQTAKYTKLPSTYKGYKVGSWATGYVSLAFEKGILDNVDMMYFNPDAPAARHEVAKYVIRALGYEKDAQEKMDEDLSFDDAAAIPQGSVGYVYLANKMGLMVGDDGKFNPMGTLTRAEMAVLFDRLDDKVDNEIDEDEFVGKITKISNNSITVSVDGKNQTFDVSENVKVYENNKKISYSKLETGDNVNIRIVEDEVVYIEIKESEEEDKIISNYTGEVTAIDKEDHQFTIQIEKMRITFQAIDGVDVFFEDEEGKFDEIAVGDTARVIVDTKNRASKIYIDANRPQSDEDEDIYKEVSGEIVKFGSSSITLSDDEEEDVYVLDEDFEVFIDNKTADYKDLKIGMAVELKLKNDKVIKIDADGTSYQVEGEILAITQTADGYELKLLVDKKEISYVVDENVEISMPNTSNEKITDLKVDQVGDFYVKDDSILKIDIH